MLKSTELQIKIFSQNLPSLTLLVLTRHILIGIWPFYISLRDAMNYVTLSTRCPSCF